MSLIERLQDLIDRYWDIAWQEGRDDRDRDTVDAAAQKCRSEIEGILTGLGGSLPAEPTEQMLEACMSERDRQHPANARRYLTHIWQKMVANLPRAAAGSGEGWVKCHLETAAIALEALEFYAAERFKGFGDDPEPYEHHLAQQAIIELQDIVPQPPVKGE